jgi:hypothetical protein
LRAERSPLLGAAHADLGLVVGRLILRSSGLGKPGATGRERDNGVDSNDQDDDRNARGRAMQEPQSTDSERDGDDGDESALPRDRSPTQAHLAPAEPPPAHQAQNLTRTTSTRRRPAA